MLQNYLYLHFLPENDISNTDSWRLDIWTCTYKSSIKNSLVGDIDWQDFRALICLISTEWNACVFLSCLCNILQLCACVLSCIWRIMNFQVSFINIFESWWMSA